MEKKPIYKKWWFIAIVGLFLIAGIAGALDNDTSSEPDNKEEVNEVKGDTNNEGDKGNTDEEIKEDKSTKSDYGEITNVRNDVTGNWRKVVTSKRFDPEDAIEYKEKHMNEDEIHFIISFATNTTTSIQEIDNITYVDVKEYVDKEEHDAKKLGSGMLLAEYQIKDGKVEQIN